MEGKVSTVIFTNNKKILIYLRDNKPTIPYPNQWSLLGGHVEEGESLLVALKREIKEEINYNLKKVEFLGTLDDGVGNLVYVYKSKIDLPISKINLNEGQKLGYFNFEQLKNLKIPQPLRNFIVKNENIIFN